MAKYHIHGMDFRSIESIKQHVRDIKRRATYGEEPEYGIRFCLCDGDMLFMYELIQQLQSAESIIGIGIADIQVGYVGPEIGKPHWGFYVIRVDGSECLFGVGKFGSSEKRVVTDRTNRAKRNAIKDQTIAYKEQYFDGDEFAICEATGVEMSRQDCYVDHAGPTFAELSKAFFGDTEIKVYDDGMNWHIADEQLRRNWQVYHEQHARLRCVTAKFNLTRNASHGSTSILPEVQTETPRDTTGSQMSGS